MYLLANLKTDYYYFLLFITEQFISFWPEITLPVNEKKIKLAVNVSQLWFRSSSHLHPDGHLRNYATYGKLPSTSNFTRQTGPWSVLSVCYVIF